MSDLWNLATSDLEVEVKERRLLTARQAAAPAWTFLASATSRQDFENRRALVGEQLDKAAQVATADEPTAYLDTRVALEDSFLEDFEVLHTERQAEVQRQNNHRAFLRNQEREAKRKAAALAAQKKAEMRKASQQVVAADIAGQCANCGRDVENLTQFPTPDGKGILCLDCYANSPEGRRMPTADEVVNMWGGPVRGRRGSTASQASQSDCPACEGRGYTLNEDPCQRCGGSGSISRAAVHRVAMTITCNSCGHVYNRQNPYGSGVNCPNCGSSDLRQTGFGAQSADTETATCEKCGASLRWNDMDYEDEKGFTSCPKGGNHDAYAGAKAASVQGSGRGRRGQRRQATVNLGAPEGDVGPGDGVISGGEYAMVTGIIVHGPGQAPPEAPIRSDLKVIEVQTTRGTRWLGADEASIQSDLRVHWKRATTAARSDYDHWNEDADHVWYQEEGRHPEEPPDPDDWYERDFDYYEEEEDEEDDWEPAPKEPLGDSYTSRGDVRPVMRRRQRRMAFNGWSDPIGEGPRTKTVVSPDRRFMADLSFNYRDGSQGVFDWEARFYPYPPDGEQPVVSGWATSPGDAMRQAEKAASDYFAQRSTGARRTAAWKQGDDVEEIATGKRGYIWYKSGGDIEVRFEDRSTGYFPNGKGLRKPKERPFSGDTYNPSMWNDMPTARRRTAADSGSTCPTCGGPVEVWADNSGGVTVNFACDNEQCAAGKGPWDTPRPSEGGDEEAPQEQKPPAFGRRRATRRTAVDRPLTRDAIKKWLLENYLHNNASGAALADCALDQAERDGTLSALDARIERSIGQAWDPGSEQSQLDAIGFEISAIIEMHEGPHNANCPWAPGGAYT